MKPREARFEFERPRRDSLDVAQLGVSAQQSIQWNAFFQKDTELLANLSGRHGRGCQRGNFDSGVKEAEAKEPVAVLIIQAVLAAEALIATVSDAWWCRRHDCDSGWCNWRQNALRVRLQGVPTRLG